MCFALANSKLALCAATDLKPIAAMVTDLPDCAVWIAHIVDKLVLAFSEHPQYSDVVAGRRSLTNDQFVRIMSARDDDTGNPMEIGEMWCSASCNGDQNAVVSYASFTAF